MPMPPRPETIGRYQITSTLGEGAMGVVYKARDPVIGRMVAIKTIRSDSGMTDEQDEDFTRRFIQEARIAGTLAHPNIVTIYDVGQWQDSPFIAMEFLEGQSLLELISASSPFTPSRLVQLLDQMARGLDYAHQHNVVHRDVKPGNIMVPPGDQVKLMDFGIAREAKDTMTRLTGRDSSGRLPYMSPQQLRGENNRSNDVYSLAATFYESLKGEPPFSTGDLVEQIKNVMPEPIAAMPREVNDALLAGLAKEPEPRPATAMALVQALRGEPMVGAPWVGTAHAGRCSAWRMLVRAALRAVAAIVLWGCLPVGGLAVSGGGGT